MIIGLFIFIVNVLAPQIGAYVEFFSEQLVLITITVAGIIILFGAAGFNISNNLGATVVGGIFAGIGYIIRSIFNSISWIVRTTVHAIPRVYNRSRTFYNNNLGIDERLSVIMAVTTVIVFLAVII